MVPECKPECKPEWNREAITVFSRLPSLRRLQATLLFEDTASHTSITNFLNSKGIRVKSRYMKVFEKKPEKIENLCNEDNSKNLQQHHHRDFGFWDDVLHLENFVCDKVEKI